MKKTSLLFAFACVLCFASVYAQRANLDREYYKTSYVRLPTNPIVNNPDRTYTTNDRKIYLSGFSRLAKNGTLDFKFSFHGTKIGEVDIQKEKVETKDDDGNVTSTKYFTTL